MRKFWILFVVLLAGQLLAGLAVAQDYSGSKYRSTVYSLEIERRIARSHLEEDVKAYEELQKIWQETLYSITSKRAVIDRMVLVEPERIDPGEMARSERDLQDLVSAGVYPGTNIVGLAFSEPMDSAINNPASYAVDGVTVTAGWASGISGSAIRKKA